MTTDTCNTSGGSLVPLRSVGASGGFATGLMGRSTGKAPTPPVAGKPRSYSPASGGALGGILTAPDTKRVTFTDLAQMIRDDYKVRGRRSLDRLEISLAHLEAYFGACRALAITSDRVTAYERERLETGAARSTVNAELAALRRAFNLAVKARRLPLSAKPSISTPTPHNARSGFFEEADFRAVLAELPEPLRPPWVCVLDRLAHRYEVLALTWAQVDFSAGIMRLEPNTTKSDEGRSFPFSALPELADTTRPPAGAYQRGRAPAR